MPSNVYTTRPLAAVLTTAIGYICNGEQRWEGEKGGKREIPNRSKHIFRTVRVVD